MARWEPNALGRLTEAALELFASRGYANTTVGDIAARAGLTERTFFNYFTDKREVLFNGSEELVSKITEAVRSAAKKSSPLDRVIAAWEATSDFFEARREFARKRNALINAHPELLERELIKMMSLAAVVAKALQEHGTPASTANLAAEAAGTIVRAAFDRWCKDPKDRSLTFHLRVARRQLAAVVAA